MVRRRFWIVAALAAVIATTHFVVRDLMTEPDGKLATFDQALRSAVEGRIADDTQAPIDLRRLTPFEWELVWFFPGNTTAADVQRALNIRWDDAPSTKRSEERVVVFTRHGRPVGGYAIQPLGVDTCLDAYSPVAARDARYVLARSKHSPRYRYLVAEAIATGRKRPKPFSCGDDIEANPRR